MTAPAASDMPAWVQAIGSVLAILAAVAIAAWQNHASQRLQRRQAEFARRERVSGIGGLLEGLYGELWEAMNASSGGGWHDYIRDRFDADRLQRAIDALERVPVHEVGNWRIVTAVTQAREAGVRAASLMGRLRKESESSREPLQDTDYDAIQADFDTVNRAMAPVVRALAYDYYEIGPISEWKEHLDFPESMIPKHLRPPSIAKANRQLGRQAVALGIKPPRTPTECLVALWKWQTLRRLAAEKKGRPEFGAT